MYIYVVRMCIFLMLYSSQTAHLLAQTNMPSDNHHKTELALSATLALNLLKQHYSWPETKPTVPTDPSGFFANAEELSLLFKQYPTIRTIVELGSWLGLSTRFMLDCAPQATLIAIDHWQGSIEHHQDNLSACKLPTLYETFIVNCWHYQNRLVPMKTTTVQGLEELYMCGITPDLIYVDASHDYESVSKDLETIFSFFPKTMITGDDWHYPDVKKAVTNFAQRHNFTVIAGHGPYFWRLQKKK